MLALHGGCSNDKSGLVARTACHMSKITKLVFTRPMRDAFVWCCRSAVCLVCPPVLSAATGQPIRGHTAVWVLQAGSVPCLVQASLCQTKHISVSASVCEHVCAFVFRCVQVACLAEPCAVVRRGGRVIAQETDVTHTHGSATKKKQCTVSIRSQTWETVCGGLHADATMSHTCVGVALNITDATSHAELSPPEGLLAGEPPDDAVGNPLPGTWRSSRHTAAQQR